MSRVLSLSSGVGMLDLAVGGDLIAVSDTDRYASEVLAERFPDVPNLGDWTVLDSFDADIVTAGLPCQPVSGAGKGNGDTDERYLYDELIRILANSTLRPTLVLENVRGFLYPRHGRLFWRLIRSLADLGYVGRWDVVRASDAGAPHRRERWFCVATHPPSDPYSNRQQGESQQHLDQPGQLGNDPERRGLDALRQSKYGPAVSRWEALTRPAPPPLVDGRLSARFAEWMMGMPDGWVTDLVSNRQALRLVGNSVCPQQARLFLSSETLAEHTSSPAGSSSSTPTFP